MDLERPQEERAVGAIAGDGEAEAAQEGDRAGEAGPRTERAGADAALARILCGEAERAAFAARVKSLVEDVPDLPNFSRFHDAFRDDAKSATPEGHMRAAYYMAYDASSCEYLKLNDPKIDERLRNGPELVSAKFVIPYPPGFPIMVPGQVITAETIAFMRKLDVKEIHGFNATRGLKLIKLAAIGKARPGAKAAGERAAAPKGKKA